MPFKFSEIDGIDKELAEKLDADTAISTAISTYIETSTTNRVDVVKSEFKQKMDALDVKKKAAEDKAQEIEEKFKGMDPEELETLRAARDKTPELQATLDALKEKYNEKESELENQRSKLHNMQLAHTINQAINEYDTKHPTVSVKQDMRDVVSMLANDSLKLDSESGEFRVYNTKGEIIATDKGAATPVDWLTMLRDERPSLFNVPSGGGASGSSNSGSAKKYSEMTEAERVALYRENREQFNQLRGAEQ